MVEVSLAFFAGSLLAFAFPGAVSLWAVSSLASLSIVCAAAHVRRLMSQAPLKLVAAFSAGLAWELWCVHAALGARWPPARNDERLLVAAQIDGIPARRPAGLSFDAWIVPAGSEERRHVRLLWRDAPGLHPHAAEVWQLLLTLRAPRAPVNPGAMDGERQLFRDRIDATGIVVASSRLNKRLDLCRFCLDAWRERIAEHIRRVVDDRDAGALIAALAVGATGEMSSDQWRIFSATGTTHLVAISGSHVTMFAVAALFVARLLWRAALCGRVPVPRESFAAVFGLAAAGGYAFLAGLSVPTERTLLMLAAWQLSAACARNTGLLAPLCAALVAIVLIDPFAALSSGFWLSFAAIVAILVSSGVPVGPHGAVSSAARVQSALFVALAPLTLAWFNSMSLAGLVVNVLAIPIIGWVLVPLILAALALAPIAFSLSDVVLQWAAHVCELCWPWMQRIGDGAFAQLHAQPPSWWLALAAIASVVVLLPWRPALRAVTLVGVAVLGLSPVRPRSGAVEITVLDVGDASAVVARTAHHVAIYGLADSFGADGGAVDRVVVPFLRSVGVATVDRVFLGTASTRGSPGLTALLADLPVDRVALPRGVPLDFPQAISCAVDTQWHWDSVLFETRAARKGCIVRIVAEAGSIVLSGEGEPESMLPPADAAVLRSVDAATPGALRVVSTKALVPRAMGLSTGASGAVQFTLEGAPVEWRRRPSGPWRAQGFGL